MKIKAIAALCKKGKVIQLWNGEKEQWIGERGAVYPLRGLPRMLESNIYTLFDMTEKQKDNTVFFENPLPEQYCFQDVDTTENAIERKGLCLTIGGDVVEPLETQRGLIFINTKYLVPFTDIAASVELYERVTTDGKITIAVKYGMILMGLIMPYDIINKKFMEQMEDLLKQCRFAYELKQEKS